jgi:hypothetical protein
MTITTIIAMTAGTKYRSDMDGAAVGAGVAVGACSITLNAVVADDGQYPLVPTNVAITLY